MWYSGISVISLSIFHGTTSSLCPVIVIARGSTTSCVIWYGHVEVKDAIDVLLPSRYSSSNIVNVGLILHLYFILPILVVQPVLFMPGIAMVVVLVVT